MAFRPPKVAIERGSKSCFSARQETVSVSARKATRPSRRRARSRGIPGVPIYSMHTQRFRSGDDHVNVYSTSETSGRSFEVQLADAPHRDEMLWVQGPFRWRSICRTPSALSRWSMRGPREGNGARTWCECQYRSTDTWHKPVLRAGQRCRRRGWNVAFQFCAPGAMPAPRRARCSTISDHWDIASAARLVGWHVCSGYGAWNAAGEQCGEAFSDLPVAKRLALATVGLRVLW